MNAPQRTDAPVADWTRRSARDIAEAIANRHVSTEEVMRPHLARIAVREPLIRAWSALDPDAAMASARNGDIALAKVGASGPLRGVPIGVKDVFATDGFPTRYGSAVPWTVPKGDAAVVAALARAGGLVIGKTATSEFAIGAPAATTNPHDTARSPGASSSGSAAAVADGMVPIAISTQSNRSVIRPAAYCGIIGFKPSWDVAPPPCRFCRAKPACRSACRSSRRPVRTRCCCRLPAS